MKKLILAVISMGFLFACSGKEEPTVAATQETFPPCFINGHDCWEVVQLLKQTKTIQNQDPTEYPQQPWPHFIYTYENPALQAWGITITKYDIFRDGGSTVYLLNDGSIAVGTSRKITLPRGEMGAVTIRFKSDPESANPEFDGPSFKYNSQGKRVN